MCNLYSVRTSRGALARKFGLSDNRMAAFEPLPAIFPGHTAPIIKQGSDGERELVLRSWGRDAGPSPTAGGRSGAARKCGREAQLPGEVG